MATVNVAEVCQNVGAAWQRFLELFYEWLGDPTKTISTPTMTNSTIGTLGIATGYTIGADIWNYTLAIANTTTSTNDLPLEAILGSPGFNTPLRVIDQAYYAGVLKTLVESKVVTGRRNIIGGMSAATPAAYTRTDYEPAVTGYNVSLFRTHWQAGLVTALDGFQLTQRLTASVIPIYQNKQAGNGIGEHALAIIAGGSDMAGVVTALRDIASRDIQTTMDNGAVTVLQYSGDIVT